MPFYEYLCPSCDNKFTLMRSFSNHDKEARCPECDGLGKRLLSEFSHHSTLAPGSPEKGADKQKERTWKGDRFIEDQKIKNPDPLKKWREERCKTLGYGQEKWTEWANEETAKEKKKETYGEKWLGREV